MIYGIKTIARYALGTDVAGRALAVRPDDTFIVSYPRSGNTWMRFLMANLLHPSESITFANVEQFIPDAEAQSSRYMKRQRGPRVIKSHQYFDHRYPIVIYVVRDPRDVALSYYDFARKYRHLEDQVSREVFIGDFVHGRLNSASWGTWGENVGSWTAARQGQPSFLLLRYEDLIAKTEFELARVARFLNVAASADVLRHSIDRSSVEHMRKLEQHPGGATIATKNARADIPFVGTATVGRWRAQLTQRSVREIEEAWGPLMTQLGYELVSKSIPEPAGLKVLVNS